MVKTLRQTLTRETLQTLTTAITFARGVAYYEQGRVMALTITDTHLRATVQGRQVYQVQFWLRGAVLHFSCTCPFAAEGACCKHGVAAGLAGRHHAFEQSQR